MVSTAISRCYVDPIITLLSFMFEILKWDKWAGWIMKCISWSRCYFRAQTHSVFQDYNAAIQTAGRIVQASCEEHEDERQHLHWQTQSPYNNHYISFDGLSKGFPPPATYRGLTLLFWEDGDESVQNLYESRSPRRTEAVMKAKDASTMCPVFCPTPLYYK
jgi:hypothetical protein